MAHGEDADGPDASSGVARGVRWRDGRHDEAAGNDAGIVVVADENEPADGTREEVAEVFEIARSFSGPLPHEETLAGYEQIVPGSARQIIETHLYQERAAANAITRLTRAESFAVATGALGAQVLTVGGLAAAVVLIVLGYPSASIAGVIPAILGASAQIVSAWRRGRSDK